jgi:hypothetical protein
MSRWYMPVRRQPRGVLRRDGHRSRRCGGEPRVGVPEQNEREQPAPAVGGTHLGPRRHLSQKASPSSTCSRRAFGDAASASGGRLAPLPRPKHYLSPKRWVSNCVADFGSTAGRGGGCSPICRGPAGGTGRGPGGTIQSGRALLRSLPVGKPQRTTNSCSIRHLTSRRPGSRRPSELSPNSCSRPEERRPCSSRSPAPGPRWGH